MDPSLENDLGSNFWSGFFYSDRFEMKKQNEVTPTPTKIVKKEPEKKKTEKTSIFKFIHIAGQFLRESKIELKKVKWPTRKELLASTAMVIFLVLVVALYLGLIDFGLIKIIKNVLG
jgi:preprotein translocase subunit SecE